MAGPRVAHHPAHHPYVDHLDDGALDVEVWDVGVLRAAGVDIVHLHFGFEHLSADWLAAWASALAGAGIALVHTVHDLENPHLVNQAPHRDKLRVLATEAAEVLTLTEWAAEQLRCRHGRIATVVGHPPVVPPGDADRLRSLGAPRCGVYVHGATVRPNLDLGLVESLAAHADRWGGLRLHVRHGAATSPRDAERLARVAGAGATVERGPRLHDDELWTRLATAGAVLLPYRWGTHSGLLEAATDLGTPVVAPRHGGFGDQGAITFAPGMAAAAVDRAVLEGPALDVHDRAARRSWSRAVHAAVYARVVAVRAVAR